jgi:hypothetical protein
VTYPIGYAPVPDDGFAADVRSIPGLAIKRRRYLAEIFATSPTEPFTREMGILAARIDAEARKAGRTI